MDIEWWKSFFEIGGVVLLLLTFLFGAGVVLTGKKVSERQAERLRTFESDITGAKTELARQQERAAKAEGSVALAEQHAAEANTKAEGFRLDIAKANESAEQARAQVASADAASKAAVAKVADAEARIAEANRAAAEANKIAEGERLARLQLEARLADRIITPDQRLRIAKAFASMKGKTVDVVMTGDTPEITRTANGILEGMQKAGVLFNFFHPLGGGGAQGVIVGVRSDASAEEKKAGAELFSILRETLGGGVGMPPPDDFEKIAITGTGTTGASPGAEPVGKSPMRLQIAPK